MSEVVQPTPLNELAAANDRVRAAAKWLIASSAAVGAALIAGSQLSSIGLASGERFVVALVGTVMALVGVIAAIWKAVQLLLPQSVMIEQLRDSWETPRSGLEEVVAYFRQHPERLYGCSSPADALAKQGDAVAAWQQLETAEPIDVHDTYLWWPPRRAQQRQLCAD